MFYSHEVLTSRKHGVATIWLVATLGSKSITQKVNRKAIMDVDVPKACDTVVHPDAPLALRLQGNLLFGISRVYDQQCGYALNDVQHMREKMTAVYRQIKYTALDPDAGKVRRDQLILQDDPSFIPGIMIPGLGEDVDIMDIINGKPSAARHFLSSQLQSSMSINDSTLSEKGLQLNISSSDVASALNGLGLGSDMSSMHPNEHRIDLSDLPPGLQEEKGILLDNDFEFDEDGNIVDLPAKRASYASSAMPVGAEERGIDELGEDGWLSNQFEDLQLDLGLENEPQVQEQQADDGDHETSNVTAQKPSVLDSEYVPVTEEISETTASAKEQQQKRSPKKRSIRLMESDERPELRNSHLLEWNEEYLRNMARAKRLKTNHQTPSDARRNAAIWVLEQGLGNVGSKIGGFEYDRMLRVYAGIELLDSLNKVEPLPKDNPNNLDRDDEDMVYARNRDYEDGDLVRDDMDEIEMGRNAPPSVLDDYSSQMPWNNTAVSIRGGSHPGSSIHSRRLLPSLGGFSSASNHPGLVGRMSRMTSASPLANRSRFKHGFGDPENEMDIDVDYSGLETSSANGIVGFEHGGMPSSDIGQIAASQNGQHDSFELCGPAAAVDTQTAGESQWLRGVLEQESLNFLEFIRVRGEENDDGEDDGRVSFSGLLPPETNTKVVATQALMHVLTLATSGALKVVQDKSRCITAGSEVGEIYMQIAV